MKPTSQQRKEIDERPNTKNKISSSRQDSSRQLAEHNTETPQNSLSSICNLLTHLSI